MATTYPGSGYRLRGSEPVGEAMHGDKNSTPVAGGVVDTDTPSKGILVWFWGR